MDFPPLVAVFVVMLRVAFWPPSASLALGQLLSVSAGGFRDSEESLLGKKEGGVQQGLCTHIGVCRSPRPSFSTARKKRFPSHYRVPFVQLVVEGMSV